MTIESAAEAKAVNAEVDTATITTATADAVDATAATATTDLDLDLARDSAVEAIESADAIVRALDRGLATAAISATAEITVSCCNNFSFFSSVVENRNRKPNCPQSSTRASPDIVAPARYIGNGAFSLSRFPSSSAHFVVPRVE